MRKEPDIKIAGLSLWVLGRQYPDMYDYWDGNWLDVQVRVEATGAVVKAHGAIIRTPELESFFDQLQVLQEKLVGSANLQCMEPDLALTVHCKSLGHMTITIEITPDHLNQSHKFLFEIDQPYLKPVLTNLENILSRYPIRDAEPKGAPR
ncbi:MAG: hypothetical protein EXR00_05530 [Alphaproteobacteria bacterium]|nr:hypothetical protein [Alphaproteobacteria bacterium]